MDYDPVNRVICVNNFRERFTFRKSWPSYETITVPSSNQNNLTVGKWYDVIDEDDSGYTFYGNHRITFQLKSKKQILTIKEYRKLKLNKINDSRTNL